MGHTRPDWSTYGKLETVFALFDLGELAARLGSIVTFDRRGNVVFLEDFESGFNRWTQVFGVGYASWYLTMATSRSGAISLFGTVNPEAEVQAEIRKALPYTEPGLFGLEASFSFGDVDCQPEFELVLFDGSHSYTARLRYRSSTKTLSYLDSTGSWVAITTALDLARDSKLFHTVKLVADMENAEYVRVMVDSDTFSLADVALQESVNTSRPYIRVALANSSVGGVESEVYFDDVIVTQNEE